MRGRLLVAAVTGALVLAGCGGDGEGGEETTSSTVEPTVIDTSSSSSPSSTPETTETEGPPEDAQAETKEGAEAFAKWYWEENGESLTTGDADPWREFSADDCKVCQASARQLESNAKKYGLVEKNPYDIRIVTSGEDGEVWRVKVGVQFDRYELHKNGKAQSYVEADEYEVNLQLGHQGEHWLVEDWLMVQ